MRAKEEIIDPQRTTSPNDFIEVFIDIRDLLKEVVYHLATVTNSLDTINNNENFNNLSRK